MTSMSAIGKQVRLQRLFHESGTLTAIALDHAISWGVIPGIENLDDVLAKLSEDDVRPDAFTILKGTAMNCYAPYAGKIPFILKATSFSPFHKAYDTMIATVEEAIRLGAEAISVGTTIGGMQQPELIRNLSEVVRIADSYGLPTVTHIYPKGENITDNDRYSIKNVSYAARIASEVGVDIIKTYYTGSSESYEKVIEAASPAKVVISGGPKLDSLQQLFTMTREGMDAGAAGVTYGRNVFQAENPQVVLKALKSIIREKVTVDEALRMVEISHEISR